MSDTGASGDGKDNKPPEDLTQNPDVVKLINAAVVDAKTALVGKNTELLAEKKELATKMADLEKQWSGFDSKQVSNLMDKINNDEETKLIAEGKIDEVIENRVQALKGDYEGKLKASTERIGELETGLSGKDAKIKTLVVNGLVQQAASKLNILPTAVEDVIYRAKQSFKLDDNDRPVAQDSDGNTLFGKSGNSPLTIEEWLTGMKEAAPHWFPGSQGAGAGGGTDGSSGAHVITKEQANNSQSYQQAKAAAEKAGVPLKIAAS